VGNTYPRGYAVNLVKSAGASPLFLAAVVLLTVNSLIGAVQAIGGASLMDTLASVPGLLDDLRTVGLNDSVMRTFNSVALGFTVFTQALPLLMCAGLWMFYAVSRTPEDSRPSTAGLTATKVSLMFSYIAILAFLGLFVILMLIGSASLGSAPYNPYDPNSVDPNLVAGVVGVLIVMLAGVICLILFYLLGLLRPIRVAANGLRTDTLTGRVSMYVVVMNYIIAGFGIIGALVNMSESFIGLLLGLSSAAVPILFSVCLTNFKRNAEMPLWGYAR